MKTAEAGKVEIFIHDARDERQYLKPQAARFQNPTKFTALYHHNPDTALDIIREAHLGRGSIIDPHLEPLHTAAPLEADVYTVILDLHIASARPTNLAFLAIGKGIDRSPEFPTTGPSHRRGLCPSRPDKSDGSDNSNDQPQQADTLPYPLSSLAPRDTTSTNRHA